MTQEEELATDMLAETMLAAFARGVRQEVMVEAMLLTVASAAVTLKWTFEMLNDKLKRMYEVCVNSDLEIEAEELTKKSGGKPA